MTSRLFRSVGWSLGWITKLNRPNLLPRSPISGQLPNSIELLGMLIYNRYKWRLYLLLRIFPTQLPSKLVRKCRLLTSVSFCTTHADKIQIANIIMNDISCLPLNTQIKNVSFVESLKPKVPLLRNLRSLFYCFIEISKCLRVFRCIDEHYPRTRSGRIFRLKFG